MSVEQLAKIIENTRLGAGFYLKPKDAQALAETILKEQGQQQ